MESHHDDMIDINYIHHFFLPNFRVASHRFILKDVALLQFFQSL